MSTTNGAEAQGARDANTIETVVRLLAQMREHDDEHRQNKLEVKVQQLKAEQELQKQKLAYKEQKLAAEADARELKKQQLAYKGQLLALEEKKLANQEEQAKHLHEVLAQNKEALAQNNKMAAAFQEVLSGGWLGTHHQLQDAGASGSVPYQRVLTDGAGHQDSRRSRAAEPTVPPDAAGHDASAAARASGAAAARASGAAAARASGAAAARASGAAAARASCPAAARAPVLPFAQTGARPADAATESATHGLWPIGPADPVTNATVQRILEDHEAFNNGSSDEEMEDPDLEHDLTAQIEQLILANRNDADPPVGGAPTYVLSGHM
jgi:hypothetical protein